MASLSMITCAAATKNHTQFSGSGSARPLHHQMRQRMISPTAARHAGVKLQRRRAVVFSAAAASAPSIQLATARLPADVNKESFVRQLYNWASTLTTNGRNLPLALPLKTDAIPDGFSMSLLRVAKDGAVLPVANVVATVEACGSDEVLMVRLYEGEAAAELGLTGRNANAPAEKRLQNLLEACIDIETIMQTMQDAIRRAVVLSR